jgi:hypothetical protein
MVELPPSASSGSASIQSSEVIASTKVRPQSISQATRSHLRKEYLHLAEELKSEGNEYYRAGRWNEALSAYRAALGRLPKKWDMDYERKKEGSDMPNEEDDDERADGGNHNTNTGKAKCSEESEPTDLDIACAKARAVLNSNIGACYVKLVSPWKSFNVSTQYWP